jgi:hypothetical protein
MEHILTLIAILLLISLPIFFIISEVTSNREFRKALELLNYEDKLNEISAIMRDKCSMKDKLEKIQIILNILKDQQKDKK